MNNELIIDVTSSGISIALLEDKRLVELHEEQSNIEFAVGDIYIGTVKKIMPSLNAVFVDVGYERDAFLHYLDLGPQFLSLHKYFELAVSRRNKLLPFSKFNRLSNIDKNGKINDVIKPGQQVLVQVAKEPISTKGPRLSSEISIPGRNIVLMPFGEKVSVSQKIESAEEKNRLKTLLQSIKPKNYGVIVRTVAEGKKVALLDSELRGLIKKWETAFEKVRNVKPPKLFLGELDRITSILRDILKDNFNSIIINDDIIYQEIRDYIDTIAPEKKKIVKKYRGKLPIFEYYGINKQIKSSFGKAVSFKNGAYLIIEHTEALHVIDVNSGNRSKSGVDQETNAVEVNLAAAEEIARQLRLRDMGGIIVVDFIDMQNNENKSLVYERMKEAMEADRTKHNILPLSRFGLMQITRQRVRPEMHIDTTENCPSCSGKGKVESPILFTEEIENQIIELKKQFNLRKVTLQTHPFISAYINKGWPSLRLKWAFRHKISLKIQSLTSLGFLEHKFVINGGEEIVL